MVSILLLILMSIPIHCKPDWCQFVRKDGVYNGLGIYRRYIDDKPNLRLYNRIGFEMGFEVTSDESTSISMKPNHDLMHTSHRSVGNNYKNH